MSTYYLDKTNGSASDSNAGTNPSLPWLTFGKATSTLVAGDTCIVGPGGTYTVRATETTSGSAGNLITYIAASGTRPILRGFDVSNASYITISGFELTNTGTGSPDGKDTVVVNAASHITVDNCYIHDTEQGAVRADPNNSANRCSWIRVANCTITNIGSSSARADIIELFGDDLLIENNDMSHGGDFIRTYGLRHVSRNNTTHDSVESEYGAHIDHWQSYSLVAPVAPVPVQYVLIEGNTHRNNPDVNSHFVTINGTADGMDTVIARFNLIRNLGSYVWIGNDVGSYQKFYNNTIDDTTQGTDYAMDHSLGNVNSDVRNNIFQDPVGRNVDSPTNAVLYTDDASNKNDYNLYYMTAGSVTWHAEASSEANGKFNTSPLFVASGTDYNLQAGSPAKAAGSYLTTVAVADTGSGTTLVLTDAHYFQPGWAGVSADWIAVGTVGNVVQIASINYATNTITLANGITRNDGDHVWLYKNSSGTVVLTGAAPDMGAFPYGTVGVPASPTNLRIVP